MAQLWASAARQAQLHRQPGAAMMASCPGDMLAVLGW